MILQDDKKSQWRIVSLNIEISISLNVAISNMTLDQTLKALEGAPLRLRTFITLRWAAIVGQIAVVTLVHFGLSFDLKFVWCVAIILVSVWFNIFLSIKFKANTRVKSAHAGVLLAFDILQLSALLYLTGGLQNPFALFLLAPTTIAAGSLLLLHVLVVNGLALISASFLAFYHLPLPLKPGQVPEFPELYTAGIYSALLIGMAFFGAYVWRVAEERRQMNDALIASEMVLAREQQLSALDGMAAAMAHELGTPLSTMSIAAKDMMADKEKYPDIAADIDLIYTQSLKCREVLFAIGKEKTTDLVFSKMTIETLIADLIEAHKNDQVTITSHIEKEDEESKNADLVSNIIERNPALIYGLGNIVSNAVRYAKKNVTITTRISEKNITLIVEDDGPGFDIEIIEYLGEPFIPKLRSMDRRARALEDFKKGDQGMGLGLFIAKTFLERCEAKLYFGNQTAPKKGARVEIIWEKSIFSS